MILIGLTGDIGSGKSTLAEFTAENASQPGHWESSGIISEIANQLRQQPLRVNSLYDYPEYSRWLLRLPEFVEQTVHTSIDQDLAVVTHDKVTAHSESYAKLFEYGELVRSKPELQTGPITPENKDALRSLLQWLGGFLAKSVSGDIWYKEIVSRAETSGVDFASVGGVRFPADVQVLREHGGSIINVVRPELAMARDATDITERERALITPDSIVYNDGSIDDLRLCAAAIYGDLMTGQLRREYFASHLQ